MNKIRVYELAKQMGISSKDLVQKLKDSGVKIKNHMSSVDNEQIDKIKSELKINDKNDKPDQKNDLAKQNLSNKKTNNSDLKSLKHGPDGTEKNKQVQTPDQSYIKNNRKTRENLNQSLGYAQKINKPNKANETNNQNLSSNNMQKGFYNKQKKNKQDQVKRFTGDSLENNNRDDFGVDNNRSNNNNRLYKKHWKRNNLNQVNNRKENQSPDNRKKIFNNDQVENTPERNKNNAQQVWVNKNENKNKTRNTKPYQKIENPNRKSFRSDENKKYNNSSDINNNGESNKNPYSYCKENNRENNKLRRKENYKKENYKADNNANNDNNSKVGFKKNLNKELAELQNNNLDIQNKSTESRKSKIKDKAKDKNKYNVANKSRNIKSKGQIIDDLDKIKKPLKNKNKKAKSKQKILEPEKIDISVIKISKSIVLKDLAEKIDKPVSELIKILMLDGLMVTQNQIINFDLASKITEKFNIISELVEEIDLFETELFNKIKSNKQESELSERPPIVVVMGHVDHGKTSLLDAIRHTNIINTEAGGITQHIGAYTVSISGKQITFLDTPGHEAFTAMRMRGAQATDIAVLVVAADDGIMPQTIEAINHAKAAGVEIVVAINKIDKPGANVDRVKQELVEYGLVSEDWGGKTVCVPVSAKNNIGIDSLLEMIILVAEMHELRADKNKKASGIIIEAKLDKGRGPIATVLVQDGTLEIGNPVVAGECYGKIRAMIDDKGNRVKKALPSTPVEIFGLSAVPNAGDSFYVTNNEKQARQLAESVINKNKVSLLKNNIANNKVSLDDLFDQIKTGNMKDLAVIIKADVQGSVEAIKNSLERLSNNEVKIKVIHGGVGAITESDIMLASASNAIVIGFNVRPDQMAKSVAESEKVDIRLYKIIYDAIEDVKAAMKGLLDPVYQEKIIGHAEVRQLFKVSSLGTIAGSYVTDGKITRNSKIRVIRDGVNIYEGEIATLKRFKDDAKEVSEGYECGILVNKFNDIKENDVLEAYIMEEIAQ